jgi:hypothetical protein
MKLGNPIEFDSKCWIQSKVTRSASILSERGQRVLSPLEIAKNTAQKTLVQKFFRGTQGLTSRQARGGSPALRSRIHGWVHITVGVFYITESVFMLLWVRFRCCGWVHGTVGEFMSLWVISCYCGRVHSTMNSPYCRWIHITVSEFITLPWISLLVLVYSFCE